MSSLEKMYGKRLKAKSILLLAKCGALDTDLPGEPSNKFEIHN